MRDTSDRRVQLDALRRDLDEAWLAPVHDVERIGRINTELGLLIGDDETLSASRQNGGSKRGLREMLAQALARTGAVPVTKVAEGVAATPTPEEAKRFVIDQRRALPEHMPSSHQVAVAIVAASKEMNADPEQVAIGVTTRGGRYVDHSIPRARAYAAFALRHVFPKGTLAGIGRIVGSKQPQQYLTMLEASRRNKQLRWWDEAIYRRIVLRLQTTPREAPL